nr:hypothetical protein [Tanacetum cinerariifolium]
FQVVAGLPALVHHLVPEAAGGVLVFLNGDGQLVEHLHQLGAVGVLGGEVVEHIYQGHAVPADGAAPEVGRLAGLGVGPGLHVLLVPAVVEQAGFGVAQVLFEQEQLLGRLIKPGRLFEIRRVLGHEWARHVGAVEPHLAGVFLLVPVAAVAGFGLLLKLRVQLLQGYFILLLLGIGVELKQELARVDVVEAVVQRLVVFVVNLALGIHHFVAVLLQG